MLYILNTHSHTPDTTCWLMSWDRILWARQNILHLRFDSARRPSRTRVPASLVKGETLRAAWVVVTPRVCAEQSYRSRGSTDSSLTENWLRLHRSCTIWLASKLKGASYSISTPSSAHCPKWKETKKKKRGKLKNRGTTSQNLWEDFQ